MEPPDGGPGGGVSQASDEGGELNRPKNQSKHPGQHQLSGKTSYAGKVAGKTGREKRNILNVVLERRDTLINFNLTKDELAKLLLKKMKIKPADILKIDTSGFGKIQIELVNSVKPEDFVDLPVFDIKDGLRTKFYRPHHRKDTLVTLSWLDLETPDNLVLHILSHFGKIKSNVQWCKIKQEEDESALAKQLNSIMSGERQVWMEVEKPIPSYAMVDGRKAKIYHPGQRRTCARCQKTAESCRGESNARLCEDNGGEKIRVDNAWKETLAKVDYVEWSGGEIVSLEEVPAAEDSENLQNVEAEFPSCDGLIIDNVPEDITDEDITRILESAVLNSAEGVTIQPTGSLKSKLIKNVNFSNIPILMRKIEGKNYQGKTLHCKPHVPVTPPKKDAKQTEDCIDLEKENHTLENNPIEQAKGIENQETLSSSEQNPTEIKDPVLVPEINPSKIPGLPQKDWNKAEKDKKKKEKALKKKENNRKKMKDKILIPKYSNLTKQDFISDVKMVDPIAQSTADLSSADMSNFTFSDYSSEEENFEDSKEELSDCEDPKIPEDSKIPEILTPSFKSRFALRCENSLMSSPDPRPSSSIKKRSLTSPEEHTGKKKKQSMIPFPTKSKKKD